VGFLSFCNSQFKNPQGIVVDSSGNVYVADIGNNRVQKFTQSKAGEFSISPGVSTEIMYGIVIAVVLIASVVSIVTYRKHSKHTQP
jgi:DNA-binding beta-propeller fold protein YncE